MNKNKAIIAIYIVRANPNPILKTSQIPRVLIKEV
jgi:hypothetical protein